MRYGYRYMDTDSFTFKIKTKNIQVDIAKSVEIRFDTSNYELGRPLPRRKKSNQINER